MNFWLLSPELSLCGIALAVILLDLIIQQKKALAAVSVFGLIIPLALTIALWGEQQSSFSGMLVVDNFSLFFKFLILGITVLVIISSMDYVSKFARFQGEYYALVLLAAGGLMLMASTGELISIYVALELASISLYALVAFLKDRKSSEAGIKYVILGAISSAVLLLGMAFVFGITGTTHLDQIVATLTASSQLWDSPALLFGIVLLVAGFGFKIASVPFQMWVPDVYEGAPTPITAYLSVASKAAGFALILRVFLTAFGIDAISADWTMIFAVLAAISMTLGNVVAIVQSNIKRMLGYSSIAHAGYIMVGLAAFSADSTLGESGILFFLAGYALANLAAFIAIIAISNKTGSDEIADYAGMAQRSPVIAFILALSLISLIGIPPAVGFMAKFYIFNAAIQQDLLWLVIFGALNSVISAYYYLRVVKVMYIGEPLSEEPIPSSVPLRISLAIAAVGVLVLGIYPTVVLRLAENAVAMFPLP
ncbi:MAG: NADH-quinone oxidoreductase subunit N [Dehalococcoidia bacterium]|nr:MAG: NADH-quinone oxidoreductase subunit N [Dehalococcoidia bacterium]